MSVRRIGPVGTTARAAGGVAALVVPVALSGITWWDVGAAVLLLPSTAALAAWVFARRRWGAEPWVRSSLVLIAVIAVEVAVTFVTPLDGAVAVWLFIGGSLLVAALRGDAACEAVAIPNAIAGRRDSTGCLVYSPIDAIEARS